jgi:large conductance mechanosensitive channel
VTGERRRTGGTVIKGFKDFIMRGNVIDLAVAVVIGAAFTAVVNAIVASIITPLIEVFWKPGDNGVPGIPVPAVGAERSTVPDRRPRQRVISFLAVAIVVYFVFVFPMNAGRSVRPPRPASRGTEEKLPTEQELLIQIRDLLEKNSTAR